MKKLIVFVVLLGLLTLSVPQAQALTLSDLQKEIEALKFEILELKFKLNGQVLGTTTGKYKCHDEERSNTGIFSTLEACLASTCHQRGYSCEEVTPPDIAAHVVTYHKGMSSPEIARFQQALIDQKLLPLTSRTGYYGEQTFLAVKTFQASRGLKADGVLGPQTQSMLLEGVCRVPITVLSPNGGEFYQAGEKITVTWKTCENILPTATMRIELQAWGSFPAYFFINTLNDGSELVTLPTTTTLPGMQYGLGYKVAVTHFPRIVVGGQSYYRDFSDNLFTINASCVANTWTKKADFGGTLRKNTVGFSIGDKGYVGIGDWNLHAYKDFWEYNPGTNTWGQKADFGGVSRREPTQFVIGDKGYVVAGFDAYSNVQNHLLKDVWEYNSQTNTWTKKADFGGGDMYDAVGFSIGDKGYVGTGAYLDGWRKDFWEYNPSTDTWTKKADFGGVAKYGAAGFSVNGKGYIGTGYLQNNDYFKDFWEYNPSTDTWTKKADFGGVARSSALTFTINGKGYLGGGTVISGDNNDFWEYNPSTDTWTKKADLIGSKYLAATFSVGGKGYIATGSWPSGGGTRRVTEYCPG